MASLFGKLQVQNTCFYRPQQLMLLYGYKEPELQIGPLDSKALLIPFLNQLLLGQSKYNCRYFVKVSIEKPRLKKQVLS